MGAWMTQGAMEYVEVARAESGRGEVVLRERHDPEDPTAVRCWSCA